MTAWDVDMPLTHGRVVVQINDDPTAACQASGCVEAADLVVILADQGTAREYACCITDHWLPLRRLLIDRGNDIDYSDEAPSLIIAVLAPESLSRSDATTGQA